MEQGGTELITWMTVFRVQNEYLQMQPKQNFKNWVQDKDKQGKDRSSAW